MIAAYFDTEAVLVDTPPPDSGNSPDQTLTRRKTVPAFFKNSSKRVTTQSGEQVTATGLFVFEPDTVIEYTTRIEHTNRHTNEIRKYRPIEIRRPQSLDGEVSTRVYVA